ncbi:MAG: hypothetical protein F4187_02265 [Gemmatimonadetes bacterium]|nr:hypothetical protein [Gemmatimonadota bacterium]
MFSPDLGLAFWTVVTFAALLYVLWRFAWGPILGALDAREKGIQDNIDDARRWREGGHRRPQLRRDALRNRGA